MKEKSTRTDKHQPDAKKRNAHSPRDRSETSPLLERHISFEIDSSPTKGRSNASEGPKNESLAGSPAEDTSDPVIITNLEPHFNSSDIVRDVVIGLSDGLTVPFALAAGLASLDNSQLVVTAGLAEVVAGAISMGLGGYMAGLSELEHYDSERKRELKEVESVPHKEEEEILEIFEPYGLQRSDLEPMLNALKADKQAWVDFMMKFELALERPSKWRTWISALTIGLSYLLGGLIPLVPYMLIAKASEALIVSLGVTLLALFLFGYTKALLLGTARPLVSGIQMMLVGGAAAGCAFGIAKAIPRPEFGS